MNRASIAVLVAPAVHPVSGRLCAGQADLAALALAQSLGPVEVFYAGALGDAALQDYLAHGAAEITVLDVQAGCDVVEALSSLAGAFRMVLCGARAEGGEASGLLPYLLAETLQRPLLPDVLSLVEEHGRVRAVQYLPKGLRRTLETDYPLVASVHPRAAKARAWSYVRQVEGKIRHVPARGQALPLPAIEALRRARPLVAASRASGHERMMGAVATGDGKSGGMVVKQGDSVAKAQVVLDYLRQHQLIDF